MPKAGFEPAMPASERLQTPALECKVNGIGYPIVLYVYET